MVNTPVDATGTLRKGLEATLEERGQLNPGSRKMLDMACSAVELWAKAQRLISDEGLTVQTRATTKAHPAIMVALQSSASFVKIMHQLGLDAQAKAVSDGLAGYFNEDQ